MRRSHVIATVITAVAVLVPAALFAATPATSTVPATSTAATQSAQATVATRTASLASQLATASRAATRTYDLDFTLPTTGKSGCLVCHGDPNLVKVGGETTSSIFVEVERLRESAHAKNVPCTGCHIDFAYTTPHKGNQTGDAWIASARLACKNCHAEEFSAYANGSHSLAGRANEDAKATAARRKANDLPVDVPLCGDCHGGHDIPSDDNFSAMDAQQLSGVQMCGQCHQKEGATYNDYYHGAAYRRGSLDAPSCWDCHGFHEMIPSSNRKSPVHESNLEETCGQKGCHSDADAEFLDYAELIHGQKELVDANPVIKVVNGAKKTFNDVLAAIGVEF